jgi:hypothetical protein
MGGGRGRRRSEPLRKWITAEGLWAPRVERIFRYAGLMSERRVQELTELVSRYAVAEGQVASALPGLWMYRADRPRPLVQKRSTAMFLSVALQGQKRMRIGGVEFSTTACTRRHGRGDGQARATRQGASTRIE